MPDTKNYVVGENKGLREGYTKAETENMVVQKNVSIFRNDTSWKQSKTNG